MDFAPLRYAVGTVTIWHGAILVAILAMATYAHYGSNSGNPGSAALFPGLPLATLMIVWMYLLAAPMVGQLFGDKYAFAQVWPSALMLGGLMAAGFLLTVFVIDGKPMSATLAQFGAFAFVFFTAGMSLFVCFAYYLMPRAAGITSYPKLSWGVHL